MEHDGEPGEAEAKENERGGQHEQEPLVAKQPHFDTARFVGLGHHVAVPRHGEVQQQHLLHHDVEEASDAGEPCVAVLVKDARVDEEEERAQARKEQGLGQPKRVVEARGQARDEQLEGKDERERKAEAQHGAVGLARLFVAKGAVHDPVRGTDILRRILEAHHARHHAHNHQ